VFDDPKLIEMLVCLVSCCRGMTPDASIRRTMNAYLLGAVLAVAGGVVARAQAGQPYLGLDGGDVVVATVKRVSDPAATNGNPPPVGGPGTAALPNYQTR
jgi:hypothetical protein